MKKRSDSTIITVLKNIFRVRYWLDYDRVKSFTTYLASGLKKLFIPQKHVEGVSFEKAMSQYNLNEDDLKVQQNALWRLSVLMLVIASGIFSYAIYNIFQGAINAFLVSLVIMLIALTLAFRYHFWYYQIKVRKLGCTVREWFKQGLMGEKK